MGKATFFQRRYFQDDLKYLNRIKDNGFLNEHNHTYRAYQCRPISLFSTHYTDTGGPPAYSPHACLEPKLTAGVHFCQASTAAPRPRLTPVSLFSLWRTKPFLKYKASQCLPEPGDISPMVTTSIKSIHEIDPFKHSVVR